MAGSYLIKWLYPNQIYYIHKQLDPNQIYYNLLLS